MSVPGFITFRNGERFRASLILSYATEPELSQSPDCDGTLIAMSHSDKVLWVEETPEEIDTLILEEFIGRPTAVDEQFYDRMAPPTTTGV